MAYADYEYYKTVYMGDAIEEIDFPRLALRASAFLDYYTQGRAAKNPTLDALKMACCAIAEQQQIAEKAQKLSVAGIAASMDTGGREVQSEHVGSWSRTYSNDSGGSGWASAWASAESIRASFAQIAQSYLANTGLLYRGGCYGCICPIP